MASLAFFSSPPRKRLSLEAIDAVVSARLGPTRIQGNTQPACFNRQVAMYLAKHVADWSTTCIGSFYPGRDHSTVVYGIQRMQALRDTDPEIDALLSELKDQLARSHDQGDQKEPSTDYELRNAPALNIDELAEAIAERIWARVQERIQE